MALDFSPTCFENEWNGTDVRDGNGDLKGFTQKLPNDCQYPGMYAAYVGDAHDDESGTCEFLDIVETDQDAQHLIILHYEFN
jgi:hypothetical protein